MCLAQIEEWLLISAVVAHSSGRRFKQARPRRRLSSNIVSFPVLYVYPSLTAVYVNLKVIELFVLFILFIFIYTLFISLLLVFCAF